MTPGTDLTSYLIRYPQEAGLGDEDPATVLDRYHTPDHHGDLHVRGRLRRAIQATRTVPSE